MAFLGYTAGDLPVTERVAGEILSLPMYAELPDEAISRIAEAIREVARDLHVSPVLAAVAA